MAVEQPLRLQAAPYSDADTRAAIGRSWRYFPVAMPPCPGHDQGRSRTAAALLILRLPERLVDPDLHRHRLARPAIAGAAQGGGAQVIEADRDPHMGVGGTEA